MGIPAPVPFGDQSFQEDVDFTGAFKLDGTEVTSTAAELNILDGVTSTAAELNILDGVTATAVEINRACDLSSRVVALTGTTSITLAAHSDKILYITGTSAATYTLPEPTGTGAVFTFIMGEVNTNGTVITAVDTTNTLLQGSVNLLDLDAAAQTAFAGGATIDKVTLNGTTTGGAIGDVVTFRDVATDVWQVDGQLQCPAGSNPLTPFGTT